MLKWFALRRQSGRPLDAAPPYEVRCDCGRVVSGTREARRQFVPCPACGRKLFVLARSPLPAGGPAAPPAGPFSRLGPWRTPVLAAAVASAVLILLFLALLPFLGRPAPHRAGDQDASPNPAARLDSGRRALADGDFHLALTELNAAREQARLHSDQLSADQRRDLTQLWRQADLLSRLSSRSLQEIVQEADLVRQEDEWQARFDADHKGRTVVFDDVVRFEDAPLSDGRRRPMLAYYRVIVGGREVRLALEDLNALQPLASERPQRMLFGGRLAAMERGRGGQWVVRFDPGSGVLLTDRGAAEAVCPPPLDPELIDVLKRQTEWLRRQDASGD